MDDLDKRILAQRRRDMILGLVSVAVTDDGYLAPPSYVVASPEDKALLCNGAGTEQIDVPDNLLGVSVHEAADIHDWSYSIARTIAAKRAADFMFLVNMLVAVLAADPTTGFWRRRRLWLALKLACAYFVAVWRWGRCDAAGIVPWWARAINKLRKWGLPV
jgi:hypothetical protein